MSGAGQGTDPDIGPDAGPDAGRDSGLAALRRDRSARLARLRGAAAPIEKRGEERGEAPGEAPAGQPTALDDFLRALGTATAAMPPAAMAGSATEPAPGAGPAAEVVPFQRASGCPSGEERPADPAPACRAGGDLDLLPGIGPGLVWALERAGVAGLADLAGAAPEALAERLGPAGALVDLEGWIRFARAAG